MKRENILRIYSTHEEFDIEELERNGIGVEIQDFTEPNLSREEFEKTVVFYREKLKDFKGIKSMHGPFMDLKPASPDNDVRKLSMDKYIKNIRAAAEMNMDYIVFHSQINPDLNEDFIVELNSQQNADAWNLILDQCKDYKGIILIENVFEKDPYMLKKLLDTINRDNVKLNLDIGHVNLTKTPLEEWVRVLKNHLVYSHVHTNDGRFDKHNPITKEKLQDYIKILSDNNLEILISLEYKVEDIDRELRELRI